MAAAEDNYVCKLDEKSLEKAKKELHENPKERLSAVDALRTWIQQQPHITIMCDTHYLLYFLRTSKFSQLKAREMVENYTKAFGSFPQWFRDIDTHDPVNVEAIEGGFIFPLPRRDKNGCCVLLYKMGATRPDGEMFTIQQEMRAWSVAFEYVLRDENVQVNGFIFIFDLTGIGAKHMTRMSSSDVRKWHSHWQKAMPGRMKGFYYYNAGAFFEALMTIIRPILSKKLQDRIRVHDTMESLYKAVGMEILPDEYLPDDYTGPSAGSHQQIIQKYKAEVMSEEFRQTVLQHTSTQAMNYDETKKPNYQPPQESFRKLNVD